MTTTQKTATTCHRKKASTVRQRWVKVPVSDAAWQALQQLSIHYGTSLAETVETLALDAELHMLQEIARQSTWQSIPETIDEVL
jgi:hypothetical protein